MAISRQNILDAIETLVARGDKLTLVGVRTELGRGSNATILPILREWKSSQQVQMPDNAQKMLQKFGTKFWVLLNEEKIKSFEDRSVKLQWALDNAHENLVEKKKEIGLLNCSINNLSTENGKLQIKVKTLLKQVASLEQAALLDNILESTDVATPGL